MKKQISILLALFILLTSLAPGCGGSGDAPAGVDPTGDGGQSASENPWDKDSEVLRENGYSIFRTTNNLYQYESTINAEGSSLIYVISATHDTEGKLIIIYYLKTEAQAAACMETLDPNYYKQVGTRIVYNDLSNIIR
ncbi:MAG: hypothetical protein IJM62_06040, partial [Lachnospiraceae bacterium]|nr:hypothetical protein [Lachnospiraceae bacterium]